MKGKALVIRSNRGEVKMAKRQLVFRCSRFVLFQSLSQFAIWLGIVTVTLIAFKFMFPARMLKFVSVGTVVGTLPSLISVLPTELSAGHSHQFLANVTTVLEYVGLYRDEDRSSLDRQCWTARRPAWLKWKEGDVLIQRNHETVVVTGPWITMRKLAATLENLERA